MIKNWIKFNETVSDETDMILVCVTERGNIVDESKIFNMRDTEKAESYYISLIEKHFDTNIEHNSDSKFDDAYNTEQLGEYAVSYETIKKG